jgi:hypothetical protein
MWKSGKETPSNIEPGPGMWNMMENKDGKIRPVFCCPDCHRLNWINREIVLDNGTLVEYACPNTDSGCDFKTDNLLLNDWLTPEPVVVPQVEAEPQPEPEPEPEPEPQPEPPTE